MNQQACALLRVPCCAASMLERRVRHFVGRSSNEERVRFKLTSGCGRSCCHKLQQTSICLSSRPVVAERILRGQHAVSLREERAAVKLERGSAPEPRREAPQQKICAASSTAARQRRSSGRRCSSASRRWLLSSRSRSRRLSSAGAVHIGLSYSSRRSCLRRLQSRTRAVQWSFSGARFACCLLGSSAEPFQVEESSARERATARYWLPKRAETLRQIKPAGSCVLPDASRGLLPHRNVTLVTGTSSLAPVPSFSELTISARIDEQRAADVSVSLDAEGRAFFALQLEARASGQVCQLRALAPNGCVIWMRYLHVTGALRCLYRLLAAAFSPPLLLLLLSGSSSSLLRSAPLSARTSLLPPHYRRVCGGAHARDRRAAEPMPSPPPRAFFFCCCFRRRRGFACISRSRLVCGCCGSC